MTARTTATDTARVRTFLAEHDTMTLATVGPHGQPQAAAVFFAADDQLNLFFLSSPSSRHSLNLQHDSRAAATVQADGQEWQTIHGLQIEGTVSQIEGPELLARATRTFAGRHEFLRGLLGLAADEPAALQGPLASSRFYVLRPAWIRLIDNRQAFGYKEEIRFDGHG